MTLLQTLTLAAALTLAAGSAQAKCTLPGNAAALETEFLSHLNAERKARGLPALKMNAALDKAAQGHACDNADRKSISHVSGNGANLQKRLKRAGYRYSTASENTGRGFASGARAFEWWMNSPHHRDNMLMSGIKDIGIGVAVSDAPDSRLHWVINMGKTK